MTFCMAMDRLPVVALFKLAVLFSNIQPMLFFVGLQKSLKLDASPHECQGATWLNLSF